MKAMILAAGLGNRMRPLTLHTPKPLLEVGGKPLIVWHIEKLRALGICEIIINKAWLAEKLVETLGDGSAFGVKILWSHEQEGLETAGGIIRALPLLGEEPFILINGDVWTNFDFAPLLNVDLQDHLAYLMLVDNPAHNPQGDFILSHQKAYCFEQNQTGQALTFSGISLLSPKLFANLAQGKRPLAPLLRQAMQKQQVLADYLPAAWVDVGTPERLKSLDLEIQQGVYCVH